MSDIGAISQAALQGAQATKSVSMEAQLFEYMAQLQAQSVVTGQSAALANPAMLSGELARYMRGFMERSNVAQDIMYKKLAPQTATSETMEPQASRESGQRYASLDKGDLHRGPAHEPLSRHDGVDAVAERGADALDLNSEEGKRLMEMVIKVAMFHTEATIVGNGARKIVDDVNMLIKAQ